jgi:hypothetical protein
MHPRKQHIIDIYGKEPASLDELAEACIAVLNHHIKPNTVIGFHWEVRYSKEIPNTHDCPLDGVTNWGRRDPKLPLEYPGWTGRVWIRYLRPELRWGDDSFFHTVTHTGTGGGGSYDGPWAKVGTYRWRRYGYKNPENAYPVITCYSWDYKFFESDWPLVQEGESARQMLSILKDTKHNYQHKFGYDDPATCIADAEFIKSCDELNKVKEKA